MNYMFEVGAYGCSAAEQRRRLTQADVLPSALVRISRHPGKEGKEEAGSSKHQSDAGPQRRLPPLRWAGRKHRAGPGRHRHAVRQQQRVWMGRWEPVLLTAEQSLRESVLEEVPEGRNATFMLCFLETQPKSWLPFSAPGLICIFLRVFMVLCWRPSPSTAVKMCLIVLCFHTAAFLFFWEEMFPLSVWKQAAGQLQVSLFLVVRLPGLHISFFLFSFQAQVNYPDLWSVTFSPTNHGNFIFTCHHRLYGEGVLPYLSEVYFSHCCR